MLSSFVRYMVSLDRALFCGAIPGDINGDIQVNIADAVRALQVLSLSPPGQTADLNADVNRDGRIGMAEVLYILQGVAGQRVLPTIFQIKAANGKITLPTGAPVAPTDLTVLNPAGEAQPDAQGNFTVDTLDGGATLNTVLSPAGNLMLLGWLGAGHQNINPRTTAEVMLFFALGADRYSTEDRGNVRWLLSIAPEVATLEAAISAELAANVDAFAGENATVTAAMTGVIDSFSATEAAAVPGTGRQALSVSIEPAGEKSGITLLMEGINKIRLSNAYRRRLKVWIDQIAYVPSGGGAWVQSKLPLMEFEVDPVNGLKSVTGTINDWVKGQSAYTPVKSDPVSLPVMPKTAEKTAYEVIVCGNGLFDGDISILPGDRLVSYGETYIKFLLFDVVVPAIVNIVVPSTKVPEILEKFKVVKEDSDVSMFIKLLQSTPTFMQQISNGDFRGAIETIYVLRTDAYKKGFLKTILADMITSRGESPAKALRAGQIVDGFLDSMKFMNAALTAVDLKVIEAQFLLSNKMETWRVEVGHPKVVLTPEKAIVLPEGTQEFSATLPEATGDAAPALTYHWKSSGNFGTITDNIHTGYEFDSSHAKVTYTGATIGTDTVEMEAFEVQGQGRVSVGTGSSTVEVASAKISIDKTLVDVAQGKTVTLKGIVEPAPSAGQEIWYSWSSARAFGRFVPDVNPLSDTYNRLTYLANSSLEGEDVVTLTVYRVVGGWHTGTRTALGQAQTRVRVWASPKTAPMTFHTYGPRIVYHYYQAPNWNLPETRWLIYGWGWSWPSPEGMHKTGDWGIGNSHNQTQPIPYYGRYLDEPYKMGLDLKKEMGIPDGVNFETRVVAKSIGDMSNPSTYSVIRMDKNAILWDHTNVVVDYTLRDMIDEANKRLRLERTAWEVGNPHAMDCTP